MKWCFLLLSHIWYDFAVVFRILLGGKKRKASGKSFGKFNFIVFSMLNVLRGFLVEGKGDTACCRHTVFSVWSVFCVNGGIKRMREKCRLGSCSSTRCWPSTRAPHTENVFTNLYDFPTKLKFIPHIEHTSTEAKVLNFFRSVKYCTARVLNLCTGWNEYANYPWRGKNLQCFHTWTEINIFRKLFGMRGFEWKERKVSRCKKWNKKVMEAFLCGNFGGVWRRIERKKIDSSKHFWTKGLILCLSFEKVKILFLFERFWNLTQTSGIFF